MGFSYLYSQETVTLIHLPGSVGGSPEASLALGNSLHCDKRDANGETNVYLLTCKIEFYGNSVLRDFLHLSL